MFCYLVYLLYEKVKIVWLLNKHVKTTIYTLLTNIIIIIYLPMFIYYT